MALVKRNRAVSSKVEQYQESVKYSRSIRHQAKTKLMVSLLLGVSFFMGMKTTLSRQGTSLDTKNHFIKDADNRFFVTLQGVNAGNLPGDSTKEIISSSPSSHQEDTFIKISSLGSHTIHVTTICPHAQLLIRITGEMLFCISLERDINNSHHQVGKFSFPKNGEYQIDAIWLGCADDHIHTEDSSHNHIEMKNISSNRIKVETVDANNDSNEPNTMAIALDPSTSDNDIWGPTLFASGIWLPFKSISKDLNEDHSTFGPYVWTNTELISSTSSNSKSTISPPSITITNSDVAGDFSVIKESVTISTNSTGDGFYKFQDLSNYELVCWLGSTSAKDIYSAFLSLRPNLFNNQRPFKFHYYKSFSFIKPDTTWKDDQKTKFRKCKHILVSMDELNTSTPLTTDEYKTQVTTFIHHLLKAFPDDTFPIWMLTTMEAPWTPTHCRDSRLDTGSSNEHPCNKVLKDLFQKSSGDSEIFPSRVRLLDNTDITVHRLSLIEDEESMTIARKSMLSVIALRIFVIVGKQVSIWRAANQVGREPGLFRGDVLEPNFELVPYDWNS